MHSTLIVARMRPESADDVAELFAAFDKTEMPHRMGTLRRQLFRYHGLYFHLQDFAEADGGERIEAAKNDERFIGISQDLKAHITAFDPETWRSPSDAMAQRFYDWSTT
ncbi:MAG TPA: TcmI family type II polyketide cyclase [Amycolatopsis sp.]|uniref:TcmI family type II polyketide cyclase n=1 Tax=Amycolatopsis sp. TaxID=37632 RepID=UPI002B49332E|nr:TcmI family type II polyketide cyclase [Amycolatopsis sp.]HKS47316.1 TcmI family type II polyketide cyclase [Amycolatopsis sp.]